MAGGCSYIIIIVRGIRVRVGEPVRKVKVVLRALVGEERKKGGGVCFKTRDTRGEMLTVKCWVVGGQA